MRVHWSLCVLSMFVATGSVWYVRTKDMNFFPESGEKVNTALQLRSPTVGPPKPSLIRIPKGDAPMSTQNLNGFKSLRFDEESALETFANYKKKGSMEAAYLTGERILENAQLGLNDKSDVAEEISSYLATLRLCVGDVYSEQPVKVVIEGVEIAPEQQKVLTLQLQTILRRSSGGLAKCAVSFDSDADLQVRLIVKEQEFVGDIPDTVEINDLVASLYNILHKQDVIQKNDLNLPGWNNATISQFETGITRLAWNLILNPLLELDGDME